jgi:hypothetical protein
MSTTPFNGVIAGNRIKAAGGGNRIARVYEASVPIFKAQDDNLDVLDKWLAAVARDTAPGSLRDKVLRNKPAGLTDSCFTAKLEEITDPAKCAAMFPVYANPRIVAGGPATGDVFKCELKPIDKADYTRPVTDAQLAQLRNVFPAGRLRLHEKGCHAACRVRHLVDISGFCSGDDTVIFPALHYRFLIGGSMSRRLALAVLAAGLFAMAGGSVATQQLPPGYVDPKPPSRRRRSDDRERKAELRDHRG